MVRAMQVCSQVLKVARSPRNLGKMREGRAGGGAAAAGARREAGGVDTVGLDEAGLEIGNALVILLRELAEARFQNAHLLAMMLRRPGPPAVAAALQQAGPCLSGQTGERPRGFREVWRHQ